MALSFEEQMGMILTLWEMEKFVVVYTVICRVYSFSISYEGERIICQTFALLANKIEISSPGFDISNSFPIYCESINLPRSV